MAAADEGGWAFSGEPPTTGGGVILVEGSSFVVSGQDGVISPLLPHGVFFRDTRIISAWRLLIDGEPVEPLVSLPQGPHEVRFLGRTRPDPGRADSSILVDRTRQVGVGMVEQITIRNVSSRPSSRLVQLEVTGDFADLFAVKEGRVRSGSSPAPEAAGGELTLIGEHAGVRVSEPRAVATRSGLTWRVDVAPRAAWSATVQVAPIVDGDVLGTGHRPVTERRRRWRGHTPYFSTIAPELRRLIARTAEDLGALRILDPGHRDRHAVAAGAPWFMALFGRDSLLTAYMAMPLDATLAAGALQMLAERQGSVIDPVTEEEPGRILHETRFGIDAALALGGSHTYFGTADATPLFVVVLGELARWGVADDVVERLMPNADRAMAWLEHHGDADGDGFVEYLRKTPSGLVNQGWKDSWDGITRADGTIPEGPIALAEVQGYAFAAWTSRAELAQRVGDATTARRCRERAARLREAFERQFWLDDLGWYALALDGAKRPVDALASNMGHCLWSGLVPDERSHAVAALLVSPEMFSGWGVRTLATSMAAYNPMSYHNGSVWPHDSAIVAAGLARYGFLDEARLVAFAVLDAATAFDGRLPELLCGFDREEYAQPVPFPTSCSPQAWASAAPLLLLRTLLGFDPDLPGGAVRLAPQLPLDLLPLRIEGLCMGEGKVDVSVDATGARVIGLGDIARLDGSSPSRGRGPFPDPSNDIAVVRPE